MTDNINDVFGMSSSFVPGGESAVVRELRNQVMNMKRDIDNANFETWCYERFHASKIVEVAEREAELAKKSKKKEKKLQYNDALDGQKKYDVGSFVQDDLTSEIEAAKDHSEKVHACCMRTVCVLYMHCMCYSVYVCVRFPPPTSTHPHPAPIVLTTSSPSICLYSSTPLCSWWTLCEQCWRRLRPASTI